MWAIACGATIRYISPSTKANLPSIEFKWRAHDDLGATVYWHNSASRCVEMPLADQMSEGISDKMLSYVKIHRHQINTNEKPLNRDKYMSYMHNIEEREKSKHTRTHFFFCYSHQRAHLKRNLLLKSNCCEHITRMKWTIRLYDHGYRLFMKPFYSAATVVAISSSFSCTICTHKPATLRQQRRRQQNFKELSHSTGTKSKCRGN